MNDTNTETLECGTSLAELEFGSEKSQEKQSLQSLNDDVSSIGSLRSLLASDVLMDDGSLYTTFTSPFEDPSTTSVNKKKYVNLPLVYCDQTASNRPCKSIERYMEKVCLPLYGNTHTNTSITGSQSTAFVAEARQIVAEETNAKITGKASLDIVLFSGQGTTSAVELLIDCLGLRHYENEEHRPVIFVGPYEHHSNLIPWRESGCEIVMVPECSKTKQVDLEKLDELLDKYKQDGRIMMGTFSAASNVTGKVSDVDAIAATLHRHGALAFFDYATGASYMSIDMNPPPSDKYPTPSLVAKDAVFLSPHKMLGGVGTPGVLIVKKHLVSQSNPPNRSGGGTVFYVTNTHHRFLGNRIERYEGGTPNIAGIVRVGLTFLMKRKADEKYKLLRDREANSIIPRSIEEYDYSTYDRVAAYLKENAPNLVLLGSDDGGKRLPIFSFLIRFGKRFLHYNYVCAILNDVFGIQSRGGCQCAGPYSQRLLGLTVMGKDGELPSESNREIEEALLVYKERAELLRPGYTRLSLPFKGLRHEEVDYVMKALEWVSKYGWAFICQYRCNHRTGEWRHANRQGRPLGTLERRWLGHYDILQDRSPSASSASAIPLREKLEQTMAKADELLKEALSDQRNIVQTLKMSDAEHVLGAGQDELEKLRWYVYPKECAHALTEGLVDASTFVDGELTGAVHPDQCGELVGSMAEADKGSTTCCIPKTEDCAMSGVSNDAATHRFADDQQCFFRDGEHTGEATFAEIREGFEEGEISDQCEVYEPVSGEWMLLSTALSSFPSEESSKLEVKGTSSSHSGDAPSQTTKKSSRDSSTWGRGAPLKPTKPTNGWTSSVAGSRDVTPEAEGKTTSSKKNKRFLHIRPPPKMMKLCTQAIMQWDMIKDGDKLLLGLSGGKDSLSLLHCLMELKRKLPTKFELEVCTIDPMTPSFDPSPLIGYVESFGLKYHYIRDNIVSRASTAGTDGQMVKSLCSYCARMKRGNLYACARRNNCNKLVLAQHLDDCAESFMMSVMHNGFLRTMKAHYQINAGDLAVIRPLVYCRESLMTDFAKSANLPVINENCPACFEEPKERARIKKLLAREEQIYPNFYDNIRRSLLPLMHNDATAILRCYTEETTAKSRKESRKRPRSETHEDCDGKDDANGQQKDAMAASLSQLSDDDLIKELSRRKAEKYRLSGAMKRVDDEGEGDLPPDPTGQVCSLNGGPGTIPCYELME